MPIAMPTIPNTTELPMWPIPQRMVIQAVFVRDHFLALAITMKGK